MNNFSFTGVYSNQLLIDLERNGVRQRSLLYDSFVDFMISVVGLIEENILPDVVPDVDYVFGNCLNLTLQGEIIVTPFANGNFVFNLPAFVDYYKTFKPGDFNILDFACEISNGDHSGIVTRRERTLLSPADESQNKTGSDESQAKPE